jgi:hypothetical protein
MASVASATWYWEGDVDNNWSNTSNWTNGTASPPPSAHSATEGMYVPAGMVNADISDQFGTLMMGRTGTGAPAVGAATVNLNTPGTTLTVSTSSGELVSVAYTDGYTNNLNVSAGRLNVYNSGLTGAGELRLNHVYQPTTLGNLNLSGTGIIDVEYLNKGERSAGGNFYATGGTLIVRSQISKFGLVADGWTGFRLGGARLEMASFADRNNVIGNITVGTSQRTDFLMDSTSKVSFDLGLSANKGGVGGTNYDLITSLGNFTIDGTLFVNFLVAPEIGDYWDVWRVSSSYVASYSGSGMFDALPSDILASWIDTGNGTDTLRLEYIPEPATIALLGLGLLAIRRNKK